MIQAVGIEIRLFVLELTVDLKLVIDSELLWIVPD